ncbi:hypothetical protein [Streptomyces sp. RS2]|uniref:hypothetical protein n=1 Tax=Streptomyces sp. RS2 TaxID=1451205 RepID=UPI0035A954F8
MVAEGGDDGATFLPFSWNGVVLFAAGASSVRVRIVRRGRDELVLEVADGSGAAVLSVGSLVAREVSAEQLSPGGGDSLLRVEWGCCCGVWGGGWVRSGGGARSPVVGWWVRMRWCLRVRMCRGLEVPEGAAGGDVRGAGGGAVLAG